MLFFFVSWSRIVARQSLFLSVTSSLLVLVSLIVSLYMTYIVNVPTVMIATFSLKDWCCHAFSLALLYIFSLLYTLYTFCIIFTHISTPSSTKFSMPLLEFIWSSSLSIHSLFAGCLQFLLTNCNCFPFRKLNFTFPLFSTFSKYSFLLRRKPSSLFSALLLLSCIYFICVRSVTFLHLPNAKSCCPHKADVLLFPWHLLLLSPLLCLLVLASF